MTYDETTQIAYIEVYQSLPEIGDPVYQEQVMKIKLFGEPKDDEKFL